MSLGEPALSATNAQILASKEPITTRPSNMPRFQLTVCYRPKTPPSFGSAAIKIPCQEVTDYSDEDEDAIVIALSTVEEQCNSVKEFPNLFPKTMPTELPPLRNVKHRYDPKPRSVLLPTWRLLRHKFGEQVNNKLNTKKKSGPMHVAPNDKIDVVMYCVVKLDQPDKPRFVTEWHLRNLAVYKKQTPLPNIDELIGLVAAYSMWSGIA